MMQIDDLKFSTLTQSKLKPYAKRAPTDSLQFLRWILEHIFRQDPQDADDACVDAKQDKGVDGILVNDTAEEILIFQSKIKQNEKATLGDTELKEFFGTLNQFANEDNIQNLLDGTANEALKSALIRNDIKDKIGRGYSVQGIFCTNVLLNKDGKAYSETIQNLLIYDAQRICDEYIDIDSPSGIPDDFRFDLSDTDVLKYQTSEGVLSRIFLADALQLTHLKGISDGSLFSLNVRLSLGNTKVNKALLISIRDKKEHKNFPLYHNGITILCDSFKEFEDNSLSINNYVVVNGAQSLSSLLQAKSSITQDLKILVKVVALKGAAELGEKITQNSNNQNAIKPRDMRSNHGIQQRLQKEIKDLKFKNYVYEVKRGPSNKGQISVSNEDAGLAILALDLQEPWSCHQKYKVMDEAHSRIFGRSDVTAAKILLFIEIINTIESRSDDFENKIFGHYALTKYFLAYVLSEIMKDSKSGREIFLYPERIIKTGKISNFINDISPLISSIIADLEAEVEESSENEHFDHKRELKSPKWCRSITNKLKAAYKKDVIRKKAKSIDEIFKGY